jgi:hypothetical protein
MSDIESGYCLDCGRETRLRWSLNPTSQHGNPQFMCSACVHRRDRAYDDYVDPLHWYHQHDPERMCEG